MNLPSIKTLSRIFDNPKRAREILEGNADLNEYASVREARKYPGNARYYIKMLALNELGGFHGVESVESVSGEYAEYLNSGDCYVETVIYWRGRYRVQCLGDFIQASKTSFK